MIWLVFLGIAAAARKNSHFSVEVAFLLSPKRFHKYLRAFIMVMVVFFTTVVSGLAIKFVINLHKMGQISPSLGIPIWMMYAAIPIGCFLMALRTVQYFVNNFQATWNPSAEAMKEFVGETPKEAPGDKKE
jgi:C4-dicarboxylate transporter DctQ subunit